MDPFTALYNALLQLLQDSKPLQDLKTKFESYGTEKRDPRVETPSRGDYPKITIKMTTGAVQLGNSSCNTDVSLTFTIEIDTGDRRLGVDQFAAQFAVIAALTYERVNATLSQLKFNGNSYVREIFVAEVIANLFEGRDHQGTAGWQSVYTVQTDCHFPSDYLAKHHTGEI